MKNQLRIYPLGGCGEIGMNMTVLEVGGLHYFIDGGCLFPDQSMVGVDLVLPAVNYLREKKIKPEAWLITHGHEDHIGALPYLYPQFEAPLFSTQFTLELIDSKFQEAGIRKANFFEWKMGRPVIVGNIRVTSYQVNHSIPYSTGLFIETAFGNILHTGDFRVDQRPPEGTRTDDNIKEVVAGRDVLVMFSDSTNSFSPGTDMSESEVPDNIAKVCRETTGAVIVTTFASSLWRLKSMLQAARVTNRKIMLLGRSLLRNFDIAEKVGLIKDARELLISEEQLGSMPRDKIVIYCTGSQGETFAGLSRIAFGSYGSFNLEEEDTVIFSSRSIPGNEKSINFLMNRIARSGCRVLTGKDAPVHVSGHGHQEDLISCIRAGNPKHFIPVHGEYRHLRKHIELAIEAGVKPQNCYLMENGDVVELGPEAKGVVEQVESGRDYVCQGVIMASTSDTYKARVNLSKHGVFAVSFPLAGKGFELAGAPAFNMRGLPVRDAEIRTSELVSVYEECFEEIKDAKNPSEDHFVEALRVAVRRTLEPKLKYKCMVMVMLVRMGAKDVQQRASDPSVSAEERELDGRRGGGGGRGRPDRKKKSGGGSGGASGGGRGRGGDKAQAGQGDQKRPRGRPDSGRSPDGGRTPRPGGGSGDSGRGRGPAGGGSGNAGGGNGNGGGAGGGGGRRRRKGGSGKVPDIRVIK